MVSPQCSVRGAAPAGAALHQVRNIATKSPTSSVVAVPGKRRTVNWFARIGAPRSHSAESALILRAAWLARNRQIDLKARFDRGQPRRPPALFDYGLTQRTP